METSCDFGHSSRKTNPYPIVSSEDIKFANRALLPKESRFVLSLVERDNKEIERRQIIDVLGVSLQAADHVLHSLRRKG